jgi:hypothetical protein
MPTPYPFPEWFQPGTSGKDDENDLRGMGMADRRKRPGLTLGGALVIAGVLIWIFWSFWIGLIVALVGLVAFGGFAKGKWY